ncbi:MAG: hypothetical protein KW793_01805 [Candidatus Doudnabacteria bacterium]|nr:hypothetical protein [Candidatus Doudnabacteria bacterium]
MKNISLAEVVRMASTYVISSPFMLIVAGFCLARAVQEMVHGEPSKSLAT